MTRKINLIVVHCSDSWFGNAEIIKRWHTDPKPKGNGWLHIGYHYVIGNPYPHALCKKKPVWTNDGSITETLDWDVQGIHAPPRNFDSIGICLIGKDFFTRLQFLSLKDIIHKVWEKFPGAEVKGHYEINGSKTCPNLDMNRLRKDLAV